MAISDSGGVVAVGAAGEQQQVGVGGLGASDERAELATTATDAVGTPDTG